MKEYDSLNLLKKKTALFIKVVLIKIIAPLIGWIPRIDLTHYDSSHFEKTTISLLFFKCISRLVRFFNWFCQGVITLAYPTMGYNPITARREAVNYEWASQLLGMPRKKLEAIAKEFLESNQKKSDFSIVPSQEHPSFTVLICFHHHVEFFKKCLYSIEKACAYYPKANVEVLIINDDPSVDSAFLTKAAVDLLSEKITFYSNKYNLGICQSANQAIQKAKGEWILHLDCDDCLNPEVFSTLDQVIQNHPKVRYISSRAIDIDEEGSILSWRLRYEKPKDLIKNNVASHLKVIRKDIHHDLGFFNTTFEGCQDYEFALRTAVYERLCFISDYLYQYRWHNKSQTVSNNKRQNLTAARIRETYLLAIYWMTHSAEMLSWSITGPYALEWKKNLCCKKVEKVLYHVALDAGSPYTELRRRLLLIEIATVVIDRFRNRNKKVEIFKKI